MGSFPWPRTPGDRTTPHAHPDSVMITLSSYRRRLQAGDRQRDVDLTEAASHWLPAQQHAGENIGDTPTHAVFVELKGGPRFAGAVTSARNDSPRRRRRAAWPGV